ncbi:MAG: cyclic nucleotide-binding domain-containing protein, partial [Candidatus Latescibacterota bacterium]
ERRNAGVNISTERRRSRERREILRDPDQTAGRLRTVSMFEGLSTGQLMNLLHICSKHIYARGQTIFSAGDESNFMFVLVQGRLQMVFPNGTVMDNDRPPEVVGELGLIIGDRRTVTVVAATDCIVLLFGKEELFRVFHADTDLWTKVLTNIIREQTVNLRTENDILKNLQRKRVFQVL